MCHDNNIEEFKSILSESQKFRDEFKKTINTSKKLCNESVNLKEEIQNKIEEHLVLLEEKILTKEEAIAILAITNKENEIYRYSPIFSAVEEEKEILKKMYDELMEIEIPKESSQLSNLRQNFLELTFSSHK